MVHTCGLLRDCDCECKCDCVSFNWVNRNRNHNHKNDAQPILEPIGIRYFNRVVNRRCEWNLTRSKLSFSYSLVKIPKIVGKTLS